MEDWILLKTPAGAMSEKDSLYVCDETENDPGRRPLESLEAIWDLPWTLSGCFSAVSLQEGGDNDQLATF